MTPAQAAQRLGVSVATVRRELATGRLGCARIGPGARRLHIEESDITAYLALCRWQPVERERAKPVATEPLPDCLARTLERLARRGRIPARYGG